MKFERNADAIYITINCICVTVGLIGGIMANLNLVTVEDLQQLKIELIEEIRKSRKQEESKMESKQWLRSSEVRHLLKISPGTLQNLRIKGTLPHDKIGGIFYYAYSDVAGLLERIGNR
ncbi:helix-turn-helix domain-containing protein [Pedobacter namyangjuensis]|uniref:helix-turn-helix domain-containing protein n=1 Tax=Pedobacter namyangjuensis TaxID=600626 RepID=UPI002936DB60|nr:helix-turn-helix domain-containing protein [Pedobacter namyangjuensis]